MDKKRAIIVGGYLGDEGKGKITEYYLNKHEGGLCIRSSGGTNTGATIYYEVGKDNFTKVQVHMLPVGAYSKGCHSYIGNGAYLNTSILQKELEIRNTLVPEKDRGRIFISKYAHVVMEGFGELDEAKEKSQQLGSTKNGVSIAAAKKYSYEGQLYKDVQSLVLRYHEEKLGVEIVDPYEFFTETVIPESWNVVIEGTQGVGLDVNHGFQYPYVSAGSFTPYGLLDGVGYTLAPSEVCMVLKAYGSYFGPIRMGAADFEDDEFRKFAGEYGTTTQRPRNLCWLDSELLKRSASLTKPTSIVVNRLDTLNWFCDNEKIWGLIIDDYPVMFEDYAIVNGKITNAGNLFLDTIEEFCGTKVNLVGIGPKSNEIIER